MAIELKNRMELDLQIRLPIVTLLQGPSMTQLVNQVLALTFRVAACRGRACRGRACKGCASREACLVPPQSVGC